MSLAGDPEGVVVGGVGGEGGVGGDGHVVGGDAVAPPQLTADTPALRQIRQKQEKLGGGSAFVDVAAMIRTAVEGGISSSSVRRAVTRWSSTPDDETVNTCLLRGRTDRLTVMRATVRLSCDRARMQWVTGIGRHGVLGV